ncbi:MAG: murein tripeptide amidase MpaA, partial [Thermoanaerobaculia bacterium]
LAATTGLPLQPSIGYPTPGSLGSYAGVERRIPIVTLELPREVIEPDAFAINMLRALDETSSSCW